MKRLNMGGRDFWSRGVVRLTAGVGALSILALSVTTGSGASATPTTLDSAAVAQMLRPALESASASPSPPASSSNSSSSLSSAPLNIVVGNAVAASSDPSGNLSSPGLFTTTNVSGNGTAKVLVPIGTDNPIDINSFSKLQTENDQIIYNINNSGSEVQHLIASGGKFNGQLPVTFETQLLVNGKKVDPNTATSITGKVELSYVFTNHTDQKQPISFKNAAGEIATKQVDIAIPFSVAYHGTYGNGWANIVAPWANNGFSAGEIVTGGGTLSGPSLTLKITATAYHAKIPTSTVTVIAKDSSGGTIAAKVASAGSKVDQALAGKAVPLLLDVEAGLGAAAGKISSLLQSKIDPLLDLLSGLKLNPAKINALISTAGKDLTKVADVLLGINSVTDAGVAKLAGAINDAASVQNQADLVKLAATLGTVDTALGDAIPLLNKVAGILPEASAAFTTPYAGGYATTICPGGASSCTVGEIVDAYMVDKLTTTCSTGQATNDFWNAGTGPTGNTYALAMQASGAPLSQLQSYIEAQAAASIPDGCTQAATYIQNTINGQVSSLSKLGADIGDLVPLLTVLQTALPRVQAAVLNLANEMPGVRAALDKPCTPTTATGLRNCGLIQGLTIVANENKKATKQLNEGILDLVKTIEPVITNLFNVANALGRAAKPLEGQIDQLPSVIIELAYGPINSFLVGAEGLAGFAAKLTDLASEKAETEKAINKRFVAGDGFPYGAATGGNAATAAVYTFDVSAPTVAGASVQGIAIFAVVVLLLGLAGGVLMQMRSRRRAH